MAVFSWLYSLWFNIVFYATNALMSVVLAWALFLPRRCMIGPVKFWLSGVAWVEKQLGLRFRVLGRENLPPKGAYIVASKHQSAWETFKMHVLLHDPAVVLKRELLRIPLVGWYMNLSGSIPIDRGSPAKAIRKMTAGARKAAAEGRPIVIFPEGTRAAVGQTRPYKSGIAALYQELNVPIVPLALNSGLLWPRNSFIKKRGTITVEFLPPIPPGLPRDEMMRRLREALETATNKLLQDSGFRIQDSEKEKKKNSES